MRTLVCTFVLCLVLAAMSQAQAQLALHPPASVTAGETVSVPSSGSGAATFYLIGPGHVDRRKIQAGDNIQLTSEEVATSGTYQAIICTEAEQDCVSASFYVVPSRGKEIVFLVHPSRVAVGQANAISAVAVVVDRFQNLTLQPESLIFRATTNESVVSSPPQETRNGIAWTRLNSGLKDGTVEISASVGELSERRVVQQVAAEPCHLQVSAEKKGEQIELQTETVRDCRGNPVPDGTIVTFTKVDKLGRSTVDAPIKKGIARTEMAFAGPATISVTSGVVAGNDIQMGGPR